MGKKWKQWQILFSWAPKSLWTVTATMKLKGVRWKSKGQNPELWPAGPALLMALCRPAGPGACFTTPLVLSTQDFKSNSIHTHTLGLFKR